MIRGQLEIGETTSLSHCSETTLSILVCYKKPQLWSVQIATRVHGFHFRLGEGGIDAKLSMKYLKENHK